MHLGGSLATRLILGWTSRSRQRNTSATCLAESSRSRTNSGGSSPMVGSPALASGSSIGYRTGTRACRFPAELIERLNEIGTGIEIDIYVTDPPAPIRGDVDEQ